MSKNIQEYNALRKLRDALYGKKIATEKLNQMNTEYKNSACKLLPPDKADTRVTICQDALKKRVYDAVESRIQDRVIGRSNAKTVFLKILFFLIFVAVTVGGGMLAFRFAVSSWNDCIAYNQSDDFGFYDHTTTYACAVGIHLLAFAVISYLLTAAVGFALAAATDGNSISKFVTILGVIISVAATIASFVYYLSECEGFWNGVLYILNSFVMIGFFFHSLWYTLPFSLTVAITSFLSLYMLTLVFKPGPSEVSYTMPAIDYSELYATDEYKEAVRIDANASRESEALYRVLYEKEMKLCEDKRRGCAKYIQEYRNIIAECDAIIKASAAYLHPSYHTLGAVDMIIAYIDFNRADTIKEAINEYIRDSQHIAIINKLDEIQRSQIREIQRQTEIITNKLDRVSSDITRSINDVNNSIRNQTATISTSLEKAREENRREQERLRDTISSSANSLSMKMDSVTDRITYAMRVT